MQYEIIPAYDVPVADLTRLFNEAFAGYLAGFHEMDVPTGARVLTLQGTDLFHTRIAKSEKGLAAFGYINRTGNISRLAAMGTAPWARRTGAAAQLLRHLLQEAQARGDEAMTLEVFEQNEPAYALCPTGGFSPVLPSGGMAKGAWRFAPARLTHKVIWKRFPSSKPPGSPTRSIIRIFHGKYHVMHSPSLSEPALSQSHWLHRYQRSQCPSIQIRGLIQLPNSSTADGRPALVTALLERFPDKEFYLPAIFPEETGDAACAPLGFVREKLHQFLMRRDFAESPTLDG